MQFEDEEEEEEGDVAEVMDTEDEDEEDQEAAARALQGTNIDLQDGDEDGEGCVGGAVVCDHCTAAFWAHACCRSAALSLLTSSIVVRHVALTQPEP